jgi:hypothetical protein
MIQCTQPNGILYCTYKDENNKMKTGIFISVPIPTEENTELHIRFNGAKITAQWERE